MPTSQTAADPFNLLRPLLWVVIGSFLLGAGGAVAFKSTRLVHRTTGGDLYAPRAMNQPLRNPLSALP